MSSTANGILTGLTDLPNQISSQVQTTASAFNSILSSLNPLSIFQSTASAIANPISNLVDGGVSAIKTGIDGAATAGKAAVDVGATGPKMFLNFFKGRK